MKNSLSLIKKELVLQFLSSCSAPLFLSFSALGAQGDFVIQAATYRIVNGVLYFPLDEQYLDYLCMQALVSFNFHGVPLFFRSVFKREGKEGRVEIGEEIFESDEKSERHFCAIKATISFEGKDGGSTLLMGREGEKFSLFARSRKECAAEFFAAKRRRISLFTIEEKNEVEILYIDEKSLLIGCNEGDSRLKKGVSCFVSLCFSLEAEKNIVRKIDLTARAEKIVKSKDDENKSCALLKFSDIQEEDKRFLKEKETISLRPCYPS